MTTRDALKKSLSDHVETVAQACEANRAYYEDIRDSRLKALNAVTEEWLVLNAEVEAKDIYQGSISFKSPQPKAVRVPSPHEGMMITSTGEWVLAEDWDDVERAA